MQPAPELADHGHPGPLMETSDPSTRIAWVLNKLLFLIPLGVIGNIIFTLLYSDHAALGSVVRFFPAYFGIALLLSIVPWFTGSLRLLIWCRFLGKEVRYRDMFNVALGAELGAAVSPPLLGGGPLKVCMLMQQGFSGGAALSLAALESLEDAVFFIVMVPIALTVSSAWDLPLVKTVMDGVKQPSFWAWAGGTGALLAAGILLLGRRSAGFAKRLPFLRIVEGRIESAYSRLSGIYRQIAHKGKAVFLFTMTLTMVQWICRYSIVSLLLLGLGIPPRPFLFMALQVIVFALMMIIPTPGGAGGAEALFTIIYGSFLPPDTIGAVTAGWRFLTFYFLVFLAAALFFLFKGRAPAAKSALSGNE